MAFPTTPGCSRGRRFRCAARNDHRSRKAISYLAAQNRFVRSVRATGAAWPESRMAGFALSKVRRVCAGQTAWIRAQKVHTRGAVTAIPVLCVQSLFHACCRRSTWRTTVDWRGQPTQQGERMNRYEDAAGLRNAKRLARQQVRRNSAKVPLRIRLRWTSIAALAATIFAMFFAWAFLHAILACLFPAAPVRHLGACARPDSEFVGASFAVAVLDGGKEGQKRAANRTRASRYLRTAASSRIATAVAHRPATACRLAPETARPCPRTGPLAPWSGRASSAMLAVACRSARTG